jgi:hypothetical protein
MKSLVRSVLAFLTFGALVTGCGQSEAPATPTDVTLQVPGMY